MVIPYIDWPIWESPLLAMEKFTGVIYIPKKNAMTGDKKIHCLFERMQEKSIRFIQLHYRRLFGCVKFTQNLGGKRPLNDNAFFPLDEIEKIGEHWDTKQEIPNTSNNSNTRY